MYIIVQLYKRRCSEVYIVYTSIKAYKEYV